MSVVVRSLFKVFEASFLQFGGEETQMITNLRIRNFKSIEAATFETPIVTLLIGPNGSGKSSVMQALAIVKNFFLNSNRSMDELFNFGYIRLGTHRDVVYQHHESKNIRFDLTLKGKLETMEYSLELGQKSRSEITTLVPVKESASVEFAVPYPQNIQSRLTYRMPELSQEVVLSWNGITLSIASGAPLGQTEAEHLSELTTIAGTTLLSVFLVPTSAAFYNTVYSMAGIPDKRTLLVIPENLIATIFNQDADLESNRSLIFLIFQPPLIGYFFSLRPSSALRQKNRVKPGKMGEEVTSNGNRTVTPSQNLILPVSHD